ncbi:MAG TPA: hypothetical protein PKD49_08200 [Hyphomicrobium sp.]|nr:hypothetical protein [Hyphomicrobium sp.]
MTILFAILLVSIAAAGWMVFPLLTAKSDEDRGEGQEADGRVAAWNQEKDRLVGNMVAMDVAYSEKRISEEDYNAQRMLIMSEAEKAAARLSELRASRQPHGTSGRTYPVVAIGIASAIIVSGAALAVLLNSYDTRTDVNPHASGRIPLPAEMAAGASPQQGAVDDPGSGQTGAGMHADGTPDVGAMVARLEARVKGPDATVDDVMMLARSYRVLNREEESVQLYRRAQTMAPQDEALKLVLASALIRSGNETYRQEGEKLVDGILQAEPKKPEAMWLKSLGLIHRHEIDQARDMLNQLAQLVGDNAAAKNAVSELLASLSAPPGAAPGSAAAPAPASPAPAGESGGGAK